MKKALALLLTLAMLATMCTVPAWAEEDIVIDIPVIEEVTEDELEEVELFGEEIELYADTHMADLEVSEGYTPLTELENVSLSILGTPNTARLGEGLASALADGKISTAPYEELEETIEGEDMDYGFMGYIGDGTHGTQTVILDLGEYKTFSGVRIYDSCRSKSINNRFVKELRMVFSDDATKLTDEYIYDAYLVDPAIRTDFDDGYADFAIKKDGKAVNINARYIKFYVPETATSAGANGYPQYEMEEIVLIDPVEENDTLAVTDLVPAYDLETANKWTWSVGSMYGDNASLGPENLYDGKKYGGMSDCWHSYANKGADFVYTEEHKTLTIIFDELTEVGGVRIYPRVKEGGGSSPGAIKMKGTYDGEEWFDILTETSLYCTKADVEEYRDVFLTWHRDNNAFKGIKVIVTKNRSGNATNYTNFTELEVLKPIEPRNSMEDDEVTMGYPIGEASTYCVLGETATVKHNTTLGKILLDGKYLTAEWRKELGNSSSAYGGVYQLHHDNCITNDGKSDSAYILYNLGKEYEFSGIRLYQRAAGNQNFREGYISISEDGDKWVTSDKIVGQPNQVITDFSEITFGGKAYDIKAQYIKIHCTRSHATASGSSHWGLEEVRLLQPNGDDAKTPSDIQKIYDSALDAVKAVLEYEPYEITLKNAEEVISAKAMFDGMLTEAQKETVAGDKLATLYDAAVQLTHTVKVNQTSATSLGDTVHAGNLGFAAVDYRLYLAPGVTITGITYDGKEITNDNEEWVAGELAEDGSTTLTLGGRYYGSEKQELLDSNVIASIENGDATGYYYKTTAAIGGFNTGVVDIKADTFVGTLVREITMNHMGDNIITVNLSDGTTKEINLVADYTWTNVASSAVLGSKDTDAIKPKTSWRYATNLYADSYVTSRGNRLFDGEYDYNIYSLTYTSNITKYDADGNVTGNAWGSANHVAISWVNGVWLDFGEPTSLSGVRFHMRDKDGGCYLYEGQVYGSNDLDSTKWDLLGTATSGGTKDMTIDFGENVTYQYLRLVMPRFGAEKWNRLVEIAVLPPKTRLVSEDTVSVDKSEDNCDVSFNFILTGTEGVDSFKDASEKLLEDRVDYSVKVIDKTKAIVTILSNYVKSLAEGTHTFTFAVTNGQTFTLTIDVKDTSKVSYILAGTTSATTTRDLVLTNPTGKAVAKLVLENGTELPFTASGDNKTLTVVRQNFRRSTDLYSLINVNSAGELTVTAKDSAGDVVKKYTIIVNAGWAEIPTVTRTAFAYDEINPSELGWKVRTSSVRNDEHPAKAFAYPEQYGYQASYWHTFHGTIGTSTAQVGDSTKEMGTYLEIDFGENVPVYSGLRHVERIAGNTWDNTVTVWGKNNATDAWNDENIIYQGKPTYRSLGKHTVPQGAFDLKCTDIIFNSAGYRYIRIKITSGSEHITANTLTVLKPTARLEGAASVISYMDDEKTAEFKFTLPVNAAGEISVKAGETAVAAENYTFDKATGVLSFAGSYVTGLSEGEYVLTVTIDGMPINVTIVKKDRYTLSYVLSEANNAKGTNELVLNVKDGNTVAAEGAVKYNGSTVPYTLNEDGNIVISRPDFRRLDDMFDMDSLELAVTFGEGEGTVEKPYTINLTKGVYTVTDVVESNFVAEEEIIPENEKWTVTTISAMDAGCAPNRMLAKANAHFNWHTGYSGDGVADIVSGRHYLDIDFGKETKFAGFRYYARTNPRESDKTGYDNSGIWHGATIYGRNADTEEWTLIKSQAFDTSPYDKATPDVNAESIYKTRVATVYFGEDVTYKQVRIAINSYPHSTAKALTFLLPGVKAPVPEESEKEEVNIKVTPTVGGNVMVDETPSLGDNYVEVNKEVTFTASSNATGGFQYWIEANTGKILGRDTTLTVKSAIGKDITAVFADPSSFEAFVSFYGRNAKSVLATSYVKKGETAKAPSLDKLYTTGYEFEMWTDKDGKEVNVENLKITDNTSFYAKYKDKENARTYTITVENGTIKKAGTIEGAATGAFAYETRVCATATVPENQDFSHWTLDGKIVSYESSYSFYAPDADITLVAHFVEKGTTVEKEVNITITQTFDEINGVKVAGFITTRFVPAGTKVIETGVIYVKDASFVGSGEDGALVIADVGKTSDNGKAVKAAFASANEDGTIVSGQYKLSAGYAENLGIKAVGFITYELELGDGSKSLKTIYTDVKTVEAVTE